MVRGTWSVVGRLWLVVCGLWVAAPANAQIVNTGTTPVVEGTEYVVAFMKVSPSPTERPLPSPLQLFISSNDSCTVRINSIGGDGPGFNRAYAIEPNRTLRIPVPSPAYLTTEHGDVIGGGILVSASKPISVTSMILWDGNGEVVRHYPVSSWGTDYRTFNLYQDRYGAALYTYEPAQTLLIAAHDSTVVDIRSKYPLKQGGPDVETIGPLTYRVKMKAFERVLLLWEINESLTKDWATDPTGTQITSNKPIGVLSGHTKGAIMRMPDRLPQSGQWAAPASTVRNCIQDAMLPSTMAGTDFVTVPALYLFRQTGNTDGSNGIDDDRGDVIRFVATANNTTLWRKRTDGGGEIKIAELGAGEVYTESVVEAATVWRSDKPVLCMQYGKSWAKSLVRLTKDADQAQAHPTVESGMPMMQAVPPVDRWITGGSFYAMEGMDNFVNIVCRASDANKILMDGKFIINSYQDSLRLLDGSVYGYFRLAIAGGEHIFSTTGPDVTMMAWNYGSLDGLQMGRAYGTPVSINLSEPCTDTIVPVTTQNCSEFTTIVTVRSGNRECGRLHTIYTMSSTNMKLVKDTILGSSSTMITIQALDDTKNMSAVVRVMSAAGTFTDLKYEYRAPSFSVTPAEVDFGPVLLNEPRCTTITVRNTSTTDTLRISSFKFDLLPDVFSVQPTTAVIPPNGSINVEICAVTTTLWERIDTLLLDLGCNTVAATELRIRGAEPKNYVSDQTWEDYCADASLTKLIEVVNGGAVELVITAVGPLSDSAGHFRVDLVDTLMLPYTLLPKQKWTIGVSFTPLGRTDFDLRHEVIFTSTATGVDSIAVLTATCGIVSVLDDDQLQSQISTHPQPYRRSSGLPLTVAAPGSILSLTLYDLAGRKLATSSEHSIDPAAFTGPGLYIIHVITDSGPVTLPVFCID